MTIASNEFSPVLELIGQTLTDIKVRYDLLMLRFGDYELHASCFTRVLRNHDILFTTMDYQSWDEEEYTHNDMYLNIADWGEKIIGQKVCSIDISPIYDLVIVLDNDTQIEIFNSEGKRRMTEEGEQWFFYKPEDESYPFLSVYSKHIHRENTHQ